MRIVHSLAAGLAAAIALACAPSDAQHADDAPPPAPVVVPETPEPAAPPPASAVEAPAAQPPAAQRPEPAAEAPLILDVRTPAEFQAGHVQGAILIPHDQLAQRLQELEAYRDRPILLYCRTGRRSGIALEVLRSNGFTRLEDGGALTAMAARGFPITTN